MNIAKAITDLRIKLGISQQELADALFVSRDLVSKWETGVRRPNWQMIEKTASYFCVPVSSIVDKNELAYVELEECLPKDSDLSAPELAAVLNSFLYDLTQTEADVFIRRYYFFDSTADIAASYHLKENHVRSTLSRTRKKLKKFIKEAQDEQIKNV
ncbi:MAG: XRE family transcriptional regulator [Clostridia bacterium]|nr:XRE family transcriptional regulator [Clostridia bacterium]